jgi:hypothetical protein
MGEPEKNEKKSARKKPTEKSKKIPAGSQRRLLRYNPLLLSRERGKTETIRQLPVNRGGKKRSGIFRLFL